MECYWNVGWEMPRILCLDDDKNLLETESEFLRLEGYVVETVSDAESAWQILQMSEFDLLILDWQLPGASGVELCAGYRKNGGKASILMLTGNTDLKDRVQGLDCGADDYLCKPFQLQELSARVRALLRRSGKFITGVLVVGDLIMDTSNRKFFVAGTEAKLRPKEYTIMEFLMNNAGQIFSAEQLIKHIWNSDDSVSSENLRVTIARLRRSIDIDGSESYVKTKAGYGYYVDGKKPCSVGAEHEQRA